MGLVSCLKSAEEVHTIIFVPGQKKISDDGLSYAFRDSGARWAVLDAQKDKCRLGGAELEFPTLWEEM